MNKCYLIVIPVIALFIASNSIAQNAVDTGNILSGDQPPAGFGDFFGDHIASNDKWVMVGAAREDIDLGNDGLSDAQGDLSVGAVYIYKRIAGDLVFHQKIAGEGNNTGIGDRFGAGIALQGNVMFVGAANDNTFPGFVDPSAGALGPLNGDFYFAGQVYVFNYSADNDEWQLVQKLKSDEPNTSGSFGARTNSSHIELFGFGSHNSDPTIALIGETENGTNLPAVLHVFKRKKNSSQWQRIQKVGAPSGVSDAFFADSVEAAGKFALVNEAFVDPDGDSNVRVEAVHVYRVGPDGIKKKKGALLPVQTLDSPNSTTDLTNCFKGFGTGMDAAKDIVVIGNPCDNSAGQAAGAVYVYNIENNGNKAPLKLVQTLFSPNPLPNQNFALNFGNGKQTISTDGDLIVVGTANTSFNPGAPPQNDAQMFARDNNATTFSLVGSIASPLPGFPNGEVYGQSVNLIGSNELLISQMSDPNGFSFKGLVFVFEIQ